MSSGRKLTFTVSYLVSSCGFSLESAKSRARYIHLNSPEKPDSVLKLLKSYGFTNKQITRVVYSNPKILLVSEGIILPKLEFLGSIGFSGDQRTKFITSSPNVLASSLSNSLIPAYVALKSLLGQDEIVQCLKRSPRLLVTECRSIYVLSCRADKIEVCIRSGCDLSGAGIDMGTQSRCVQKLGMVRGGYPISFQGGSPHNGILGEKKRNVVEFFVDTMGLTPSVIAKAPAIMGLSLEKRIRPRCLVMSTLLSASLLKKGTFTCPYVLTIGEKIFMERFVTKYCKDAPGKTSG
ncbi:PREDICTED: transcription termination factor MTERF15, mitochondrial-like [Tarenaya hassleriana]|uniref:transcription termination factor MTERF15, mitochondrial-like n=1 Tax=Tarenaya hassleriana TaxID=28532 RepID=UPI0008FD2CB3|nr:PREDICTED: transcription termination factor MTERF15, mitochondrial-like [Tarenaya hassleriana]